MDVAVTVVVVSVFVIVIVDVIVDVVSVIVVEVIVVEVIVVDVDVVVVRTGAASPTFFTVILAVTEKYPLTLVMRALPRKVVWFEERPVLLIFDSTSSNSEYPPLIPTCASKVSPLPASG